MRTPYEQAMDQVRLSDEQKRSLANSLQAAWDVAEKPSCSEAAPATAGRLRRRRLACVLATAAALVVGTCGLALASSLGTGGLAALVQQLFGGAAADPAVVEQVGASKSISATCNGVTVSLEAIVGDEQHLYLLVKFTDDLETNFGLGSGEEPTAVYPAGCLIHGASPGSSLVSGGYTQNAFLDPEASPNVIYTIMDFSLEQGSWPGQDVVLTLSNLRIWGTVRSPEAMPPVVPIDGTWTLTFTVDYSNTTRELPSGQTLRIGKSQLVIGSIYLSPIGVDIVCPVTNEAVENGTIVAPFAGSQDLVWMPVVLTMDDGTTLELGPGAEARNGSSPDSLYDGEVKRTARADRIIDPHKVVSIAIGDQLVVEVPRE